MLQFPPPVHGSSIVGQQIKDSKLINETFDCRFINLLASHHVSETGKFSIKKVLEFVVIWYKTSFSVLFKRPDLVYFALTTTGMAFLRDVLLVALLKILGLKRIYHLHNKGIRAFTGNAFYRRLYRFVFNNSDVILLSKSLYEDVKFFVPESRVHICPNGIQDFQTVFQKQKAKLKKQPEILFLSNLIETKGVFILLDACNLLKNKKIGFHCTFVGGEGDISEKDFIAKVNFLNLQNQISYAGKKFGQEKVKAFKDADIFVFPTYYSKECFPLVILEAMAAGLPVISTFEGGIPDIIKNGVNGFVIEQQNVEMLANQMEILVGNPVLCKKMGKVGREKFENKFEIEIFEHKLSEILQQII